MPSCGQPRAPSPRLPRRSLHVRPAARLTSSPDRPVADRDAGHDRPALLASVIYLAPTRRRRDGPRGEPPARQPEFPRCCASSRSSRAARAGIRLCAGGPVDHGRGFVLHTADWTGDGTLRVDDALALTANLDVLKAFASGRGPLEGLLALGYAGWGPGSSTRRCSRTPGSRAGRSRADVRRRSRQQVAARAGSSISTPAAVRRRRPCLNTRAQSSVLVRGSWMLQQSARPELVGGLTILPG